QIPIICPASFRGASFVTELNPTGLKHNSPNVCSKYVKVSQPAEALFPDTTINAAPIITAKPAARNKRPSANFKGIDGSRFLRASQTQSHAKTGANAIMKTGPSI